MHLFQAFSFFLNHIRVKGIADTKSHNISCKFITENSRNIYESLLKHAQF